MRGRSGAPSHTVLLPPEQMLGFMLGNGNDTAEERGKRNVTLQRLLRDLGSPPPSLSFLAGRKAVMTCTLQRRGAACMRATPGKRCVRALA